MIEAKTGDRVIFNFVAKLKDGTEFDSSESCHDDDCGCGGPLEFTIGANETFPALEKQVLGMKVGDKKTVVLHSVDAYGEREEEGVFIVPLDQFPEEMEPAEDMMLELVDDDDEGYPAWIVEVNGDNVTLDTNHPLAGEELTYELELTEIVPAH